MKRGQINYLNFLQKVLIGLSPIYIYGLGWINFPYFSYLGLVGLKFKINFIALFAIILLFIDIGLHEIIFVQKEYWLIFFSLLPYIISYIKLDKYIINGILAGTIISLLYYSIELVVRIKYMNSGNIAIHNTYADFKFGSIAGQDTNFTAIYLYSILLNILFLREKINKKVYKLMLVYVCVLIGLTMCRAIMVSSVLSLMWCYRKLFNIKIISISLVIVGFMILVYLRDDGSLISKIDILISSIHSADVYSSITGLLGDYSVTSTELEGANYTGHSIAYLILNKLSILFTLMMIIILLSNKKNIIYNIIFIISGFSLFPFMFVPHSISMLLMRSDYKNA